MLTGNQMLLLAAVTSVVFAGLTRSPLSAQSPQPPAALPALASPVYRLTLEQARDRALTNNKALILARLNADEKALATSAAKRDYFPKFLASDTYFHFDRPLGTVLTTPSGPSGGLPSTTVAANVLNQDTNLATVLAAQPITKLIAVNALVQIARADENIARAKLDQGTRDLLSGVTQAYYGLTGAQRIRDALELQIKVLEQLAAAKPSADLRVGLLEARQGLAQVKGQIRELTDQMNNLLDFPVCTQLELVDPVPPPPQVTCADEAARLAVSCNGEVREAEETIAKAEAALKIARMDYLPDVNVIGGYANQTGASYIQPNFGYLGITGSYTLFDWGKRREVKRDRQTLLAVAQQNLAVTRDKVELEARKTYGTFEQAQEAYRLAGEMVQARREAEKGAADAGAMLTAKGATAKAELEYMKAEIAYRVAHAQLMGIICCQ
jgi:outer membrane protein TolC